MRTVEATKWKRRAKQCCGGALLIAVFFAVFFLLVRRELHEGWKRMDTTGLKPAARYSHGCDSIGTRVIISHGYYFDQSGSAPRYLDDTWVFELTKRRWTQLKKPKSKTKTESPSPRYGATLTCFDENMCLLIGGDDGGIGQKGGSYVWGSYFKEVWIGLPRAKEIEWIQGHLGQNSSLMPITAHTSTIIGSMLYVFGGLVASEPASNPAVPKSPHKKVEPSSVMYRVVSPHFGVENNAYRNTSNHIVECKAISSNHSPPPRYAHVAGGWNNRYIYVFGGAGKEIVHLQDLWRFDTFTDSWVPINPGAPNNVDAEAAFSSSAWSFPPSHLYPSPRQFSASTVVPSGQWFIHGGCLCAPSCSCFQDVWMMDFATGAWSLLPIPGKSSSTGFSKSEKKLTHLPAIYRHSLVSFDGSAIPRLDAEKAKERGTNTTYLVTFGGESYVPYMYHNDIWTLDVFDCTNNIRDSTLFLGRLQLSTRFGGWFILVAALVTLSLCGRYTLFRRQPDRQNHHHIA